MGKKNNKKNTSGKNKQIIVSVCTPTFNRRPFVSTMIQMYENQDYPKHKMEWIIIDDGSDKIEDLITEAQKRIPNIKYFKYDEKMPLGKKRNLMHEKSIGNIIVYMDDDDYYPPCRVSHAVETLNANNNALCAGSSEIYVYFKHINKVIQFGPYSPNHATAGTFAFKRKLLHDGNTYNNEAALAEEKQFLKDYTVPFVQLDPKKTILVFSHEHNTFDKRKLLENPNPQVVKDAKWTVKDLVIEGEMRDFFQNKIHGLLKSYEPGLPKHKPDVLKQTEEIKLEREQMMKVEQEKMRKNGQIPQNANQPQIIAEGPNGEKKALSMDEIIHILRQKDEQVRNQQASINQLEYKITDLTKTNNELSLKNTVAPTTTNAINNFGDDVVILLNQKIKLLELQLSNLSNSNNVSVVNNIPAVPVVNNDEDLVEKLILQGQKIRLLETQVNGLKDNKEPLNVIMEGPDGKKKSLSSQEVIELLKEKDGIHMNLHSNFMRSIEQTKAITNENELLKEKVALLEHMKHKLESTVEMNAAKKIQIKEKEVIEISIND
jgi:glycosyltransferase involved in cell wall biosynthesis